MQKVRCYFKKLQLLVSIKFQILLQILKFYFTFPLQYFTLSIIKNLDLRMVPHYSNITPHVTFYFFIIIFILQGYIKYMFPSLAYKIKFKKFIL